MKKYLGMIGSREVWALSSIALVAIFFRFFRLGDFQYWSLDEEFIAVLVRKVIVEHKVILLSPNAAIEVSLGSFFHLFSSLVYFVSGSDPTKVLMFGSALGVLTALLMYYLGREIGGKRLGFIGAFLCSSSFLMSFFDRRWWPLSLDPMLAVLSMIAVVKMLKSKYYYFILLAFSASFSWHSDPSLMVIVVFAVLAFGLFRLRLFRREYVPGVVWIVVSVLPFVISELRHPGSIVNPLIHLFARPSGQYLSSLNLPAVLSIFEKFVGSLTRFLFLASSTVLEEYLGFFDVYKAPLLSPLSESAVVVMIVSAGYFGLRKFSKDSYKSIPVLFLLCFLFGTIAWQIVFRAKFHLMYFAVAAPAFFMTVAIFLDKFSGPRTFPLSLIFLLVTLVINVRVLFSGEVRYPLRDKERVALQIVQAVGRRPFGLYYPGFDGYTSGIGGLLALKDYFPQNASYYKHVDWFYRAYSMYARPFVDEGKLVKIYVYPRSYNFLQAEGKRIDDGNLAVSLVGPEER